MELIEMFAYFIAYLIGLFVTQLLWLPAPVWGILVILLLAALIYRQGWNDGVKADYNDDLAKAEARRRARWRS